MYSYFQQEIFIETGWNWVFTLSSSGTIIASFQKHQWEHRIKPLNRPVCTFIVKGVWFSCVTEMEHQQSLQNNNSRVPYHFQWNIFIWVSIQRMSPVFKEKEKRSKGEKEQRIVYISEPISHIQRLQFEKRLQDQDLMETYLYSTCLPGNSCSEKKAPCLPFILNRV